MTTQKALHRLVADARLSILPIPYSSDALPNHFFIHPDLERLLRIFTTCMIYFLADAMWEFLRSAVG